MKLGEGVQGQEKGGLPLGQVRGGAVQVRNGFLGDGTQASEQAAIAVEGGP